MEDSTAMTIEFLRARLLAERSVSRTAKQRADELAKRVIELEKQLNFVSVQRKKAEKATADVLDILKNHGRSDVSETFDSSSDEDEISSDFKGGKASENVKARENGEEGFSGSDEESSSVNSRSLSWKSSKDSSSRSLKKKYMEASSRIRNSFTSNGSSPRRVGKSCRQIRRREHRSAVNGPENDATTNAHSEDEVGKSSEGVLNSTNITIDTSREDSRNHEEKTLLEISTSSGILENHSIKDDHNLNDHGSEIDMERALEHQAQLIGRYEALEKTQIEWEDKFRENDSPQDSCDPDPGTHSDVTEERNEIKTPAPPQSTSKSQETENGAVDTTFNEEPKTSIAFEPSSHIDTKLLQDQKSNGINNEKSNNPPVKSFSFSSSGKANELILITPHENPDNLVSVLDALQQAKLSLKQNLERFPLLESGPPAVPKDKFPVPFSPAGLFRLPTDYQYGGVTTANSLSYDSRLSLTNYPTTNGQTFFSPSSRSITALDDRFHMVPTFPYQEITPGALFQQTPVFVPILGVGPSAVDPRLGVGPSGSDPRLGLGPSGSDPRFGAGPSRCDPRLGVGPSRFDPRLGVGPSGFDPRLGLGPSAVDSRLGVGLSGSDTRLDVGQSGSDPRLGAGPSAVYPRLDVSPPFTSNRYTRSLDHPSAGLPSSSAYNHMPDDGRNPSLHPGKDYTTSPMYR